MVLKKIWVWNYLGITVMFPLNIFKHAAFKPCLNEFPWHLISWTVSSCSAAKDWVETHIGNIPP